MSLHKEFADQGLKIIAVNVGDKSKEDVAKFVREQEIPYTVLLDGPAVFKKQYLETGIPQTYLIDRSGVIQHRHTGWHDGDHEKLQKQIAELLKS